MFDVFFMSYGEPNAEENFARLLEFAPHAKRVSGVSPIHKAHQTAAARSTTPFFFTVDADNWVLDSFNFKLTFDPQPNNVYVWRCRNAVNGLTYGYGAIKLFHRASVLRMSHQTVDMTTSAAQNYQIVSKLASETRFNTNPFESWKSGFREACKLASKVIPGQIDHESDARLRTWCTGGAGSPYGRWCIQGAQSGRSYGEAHRGDPQALTKINDWAWLQTKFQEDTEGRDPDLHRTGPGVNDALVHLLKDLRRAQSMAPDIPWDDVMSEGQLASKAWLIEKMRPLVGPSGFDRVLFCGGWVGSLAALMFLDGFAMKKVVSMDLDPSCAPVAEMLNRQHVIDKRFKAETNDMFSFDYQSFAPSLIVNTSCDHVAPFSTWWNLIPDGTLCALQNNDFEGADEDHVNTIQSLDVMKKQAPMANIIYAGELHLQKYRRFMLIGIK